ncbi:MAG TPA: hypothetical protein VN767_04085 [Streptosporangiaceae bacterium]|nr:hypothetical protein [Streptosporangiaceae bacterium]
MTKRNSPDVSLTELRHRVVRDSAELARVAYLLARKYTEEGDHVAAARWNRVAQARPESADLLDALIAHYDPIQPADAGRSGGRLRPVGDAAEESCPLGGLTEIMRCRLTLATVHVGTCRSCQQELLQHGGIVPVTRRTRQPDPVG